jgi:hypothetical protein
VQRSLAFRCPYLKSRPVAIHHDGKANAPLVEHGIEINRIGFIAIEVFDYRIGIDIRIPPCFTDIGLLSDRSEPLLVIISST